MLKQGCIYLANLNPNKGNEVGKTRPVLVMQTNWLNEINHPTITILPLSTQLIDHSFLRVRVDKQGLLTQDSDILCDQIRTIDIKRLQNRSIAQVSAQQMQDIEQKLHYLLLAH